MADLRKLTILHSNDMHGDFLAEQIDDTLVGGVSMLSGYIQKVRSAEENVLYAIAGDMFRGSIIDSEFKGISTVDIMNLLAPDVVSLGNHELDYGVAHLLFLEKCTKFPVVNANLYIKTSGMRLFNSHVILHVGGMNILFIGLLTEEIMTSAKTDLLLGTFVNVADAAVEAGRIINSYKSMDIDFTVLLTHIGFEEDKKLAALLDPEWGVDVIIGGHTHTFPDEPAKVNDVLIVQAGTGTDVIGRFDITINCDTNSVHDYTWRLVPINEKTCPRDPALEDLIYSYKQQTDDKYGRVLTRFDRALTHPRREQETELGNLFADILMEHLGTDLVLVGSGSIRKKTFGPIVTLQDLMEIFPFNGRIYAAKLYGRDLKHAICYICRDEMLEGHTEFYQVSSNVRINYNFAQKKLLQFTVNGEDVEDDRLYTVALQAYHFNNISSCLDIPEEAVPGYDHPKCIATSDFDILLEHFNSAAHLTSHIDGRFTISDRPF
ncbi:MAG: bifunctional metallophosphatase/5'-nucleotidase [Clostridiales bacterium]|nr:bifunctional metallophosphatase/5'-nucleotidase [Clostridiales bacterium]